MEKNGICRVDNIMMAYGGYVEKWKLKWELCSPKDY